MNGFVCLLMFVFCVCLTAVALSGLFANMLVHEMRQACGEAHASQMRVGAGERQREGEGGRLREAEPHGPQITCWLNNRTFLDTNVKK